MTSSILLADVGGTFTRFALAADDGTIGEHSVHESGQYPTFEAAAAEFLREAGEAPARLALAAAGPVQHGVVTLTNGPQWRIDPKAVAARFGGVPVLLVNDFAALAAGAPSLPANGIVEIAAGEADPAGAIAVVGPGTGLGVALLAPTGRGHFRVLPGEGGHASPSPSNDREIAILYQLIRRFGHVRAEHVLSGTGLEILWETLAGLDGTAVTTKPTAGEIAERAKRKSDDLAQEAVTIFTGWLGGFAGDVALIAGATGGVYLAGGVLPRWGELFDKALFLRRFRAKGSHKAMMEAMPIKLITDAQATFKGLLALIKAGA